MSVVPTHLELVGSVVALRWSDGTESYLPAPLLRAHSPSAEVSGERDIFGNNSGGGAGRGDASVTVLGWEWIGAYAVRFDFSDGHRTGLYTWSLLRQLAALPEAQ